MSKLLKANGKSLPSMKTEAIWQGVANILRKAILDGQFLPGEEIAELELAAQLGTSRGPVREALLVLTQEGLVGRIHNRGFFVCSLNQSDYLQIYQVRVPIEALALKLARVNISVDQLAKLKDAKASLFQALDAGSFLPSAAQEDFVFHCLVWEASGNRWLEESLKRMLSPLFAYSQVSRRMSSKSTDIIKQGHDFYIDYLERKTSRTAEECVYFHVMGMFPDPALDQGEDRLYLCVQD